MIQALYSGISGLRANANRVRSTANNIANINTTAYKTTETVDQSLSGNRGVVTSAVKQVTSQGHSFFTGNSLDLAIQGEGFFVVQLQNGRTGFTRNGSFRTDSDGRLTDSGGNVLQPEIRIPSNAESLSFAPNGEVKAMIGGRETTIGWLEIARFNNPSGLTNGGGGISFQSASSGAPVTGRPGTGGMGSLLPNSLESSNVDLTSEIVNLIVAKHGYKANLKTIQTADELLGATLDIKS